MVKYIEFGGLSGDEGTENIDVYAYYLNEVDWTENKDVISVSEIYENRMRKIEITNNNGDVLYKTYVENGYEAGRIIDIIDAVLGVTSVYTNFDD